MRDANSCFPMVVESDANEVIKVITGVCEDISEISSSIEEIKALSSVANVVSFNFCHRKANRLAHNLARAAAIHGDFVFFKGIPPPVEDEAHLVREILLSLFGSPQLLGRS